MPAITKIELVEWLTMSNALSSLWTWLDFGLNCMLVLFFGQEYISRENYAAGFNADSCYSVEAVLKG